MDDTDYHETECALRETEEEIGLSSEFIDVSFICCKFMEKFFSIVISDMGSWEPNNTPRWSIDSSNNCANQRFQAINGDEKSG
jgi:8-oxo-dGTP pyrophosphatase MutT (NUDIX family)